MIGRIMKNGPELVKFIETEFKLPPTQYVIKQPGRSIHIHVYIAINNTLVDVSLGTPYYKHLTEQSVGLAISTALEKINYDYNNVQQLENNVDIYH